MSNDELDKIEKALDELGCKEEYLYEKQKYMYANYKGRRYETLYDMLSETEESLMSFCLNFGTSRNSFDWELTRKGVLYWSRISQRLFELYERDVLVPMAKRLVLLMKRHKAYLTGCHIHTFYVRKHSEFGLNNDEDILIDKLVRIGAKFKVPNARVLLVMVHDNTKFYDNKETADITKKQFGKMLDKLQRVYY